jgi:acetolactate synthase-1/2/3 large subunit
LKADREAFHGVDDPAFIHEMFKKITKWSARVERIEDIPGVMARAFHIARSGRPGPVHVELPRLSDYSEFILQEAPAALPAYQAIPIQVAKPEPNDVDRFAKRLLESRSPVIAAGKGIIRKKAMGELAELSLRLQAPVVFAQDAIGVIPEAHPFFAGHFQHYRSHPLCIEALKHTDLVLGVGLRAGTAELSELRERAPEKNFILIGSTTALIPHQGRTSVWPILFSSPRCSSAWTSRGLATKRSSGGWPRAKLPSARASWPRTNRTGATGRFTRAC